MKLEGNVELWNYMGSLGTANESAGLVAKIFLRFTFLFQLLMAGLVIYFVAL